MPVATTHNSEPIPGYALKDRLGAGGYGEVWACEAPGGLTKAIKFVYGYLDEHRAARELKALNRVKQLRHPFLLSLERIEVVDGQLVIVTELAESNLKERFDACIKKGLPGIPREELLVYLGDAADALDFMVEQHSLQHLDVKPENLLLVGNRVKVADFGLVKEVHDVTASLMGGLTPLYAPPEVFDNRPSRQSDQYSLAIVFQEMLTGVLPFPGTTAAQLATQHLNSRPRLGALPERDQPVIARALEKDPLRRFTSCRELVQSLHESARAPSSAHQSAAPAATVGASSNGLSTSPSSGGAEAGKGQCTEAMAAVRQSAPRAVRGSNPLSRTSHSVQVVALPPVDLSTAEPVLRPTVFVGLGGVAGSVLKHLRRRLFARYGDPAKTPSLRMLLIDADAKSAMRAAQGDSGQGLLPHETLIAPLRRTQSYRDASTKLLKWISRRWLYNIPKSLLTEGMRPLGRLALADHAELAHDKLTQAVEEIQSERALQATASAIGLKSVGAPRVVVIASTSGGAGSGMALDVGYMARQTFQELSIQGEVLGLLAHGTGRLVAARELALANSFACLSELHHYSQSFTGYPGDAACQLPAFPPGVAPFDTSYVVHLGDDLNEDGFEAAADRLAAYLYLDAATTGGMFFTASRRAETSSSAKSGAAAHGESAGAVVVRSFGICQIDGSQDDVLAAAIDVVCRGVCLRWRGAAEPTEPSVTSELPDFHIAHQKPKPSQEADTHDIERFGQELADGLELLVDPLVARVNSFVDQSLGSDSATYFRQILAPLFPQQAGRNGPQEFRPTRVEETLATLDSLFGAGMTGEAQQGGAQETSHSSFYKSITAQVDMLAAERGRVIRDSVMGLLDRSKIRTAGAVALAEWNARRLQELETNVRELSQHLANELARVEQHLPGRQAAAPGKARPKAAFVDEPRLTNEWRERLFFYAQLRLGVLVARAAARFTQLLRTEVGATEHAVKTLKRDISHLENEFRVGPWNAVAANSSADSVKSTIVTAIRARLGELTMQVDRACLQEMFAGESPLRMAAEKRLDFQAGFADRLRAAARVGLSLVMRDIDLSAALLKGQGGPSQNGGEANRLAGMLEAAHPKLLEAGGEQRMLLVLPEGSSETSLRESISQQFGQPPTVVFDSDRDAAFCHEARGLPLGRVAAAIIDHRPEYAQAAQRLHTRTDVEWTAME